MNIQLNLRPQGNRAETTASINGSMLTLNRVDYDLSDLPDGAIAEHPDLGTVTRVGEHYECTIILGHGPNAPRETRFPEPITLINHSGVVTLPPYDAPQPDQGEHDELD